MKSEFLGGQKHGEWIVCYENSNVHYSSMYVDGSREGTWFTYYENGKIWKSFNYELDKLNGLSIVYSSDGKILFKGEYKKGVAVGNSNKFYENGEIEETCYDGKEFRICRSFNENGKITSEVKYNLFTGKKTSVSHYDEHGKINEEHFYNDDGDEIDNKSIIEIFDENGNKIGKLNSL
jgi:antitoxin component YwqK of YwqJK toxin-antitoxin module